MTVSEFKLFMIEILSDIGVPVGYQTYSGSEDSYFTFFILSDGNVAWGDGTPIVSGIHVQLDGWSKGDMDDLCESTKTILEEAGFLYEIGRDLYESDTETFHRVQQFYFCKEK